MSHDERIGDGAGAAQMTEAEGVMTIEQGTPATARRMPELCN